MKSSISYASSNPFGMPMPGRQYISALASKRFGYQGHFAEKDEETGYNNFYFRDYDAEVGRFLTFDPMNEFHSPYVGMGNNPISFTDPTGGCVHCGVVSSGGKSAVAKFIADFGVDMAIGIGTGTAQGGVNALNGGQAGPSSSSVGNEGGVAGLMQGSLSVADNTLLPNVIVLDEIVVNGNSTLPVGVDLQTDGNGGGKVQKGRALFTVIFDMLKLLMSRGPNFALSKTMLKNPGIPNRTESIQSPLEEMQESREYDPTLKIDTIWKSRKSFFNNSSKYPAFIEDGDTIFF